MAKNFDKYLTRNIDKEIKNTAADYGSRGGELSFYKKLGLLYILNIADWICTEALIASGHFSEANPIMQPVLQDFWLTLLIKGILPFGLILGCALIYRLANVGSSRTVNFMLNAGLLAYVLVNVWHIVNFAMLFFNLI